MLSWQSLKCCFSHLAHGCQLNLLNVIKNLLWKICKNSPKPLPWLVRLWTTCSLPLYVFLSLLTDQEKKKLFFHGGESSSEPAVHWPWLNLSSLAMSPCHFTSHPSFFSAINYSAKIEWENACQIPSTGLKHWMLWTPGSAWNTAFAKSLLTDLQSCLSFVSLHNPKSHLWLWFRWSLVSDWVLLWLCQPGSPSGTPGSLTADYQDQGPALYATHANQGQKLAFLC